MKRYISYFAVTVSAVALFGCASNDYAHYAAAIRSQAAAKALISKYAFDAQKAKYEAMSKIAENGDNTAKALASMSLGMSGNSAEQPAVVASTQNDYGLSRPESTSDKALKWSSILVNPVVTAYGINRQASLGEIQSNNSTTVQLKQYDTMLGFGKLVPKSPVIVGSGEQKVLYPIVGDDTSVLVTPTQ